MHRQQTIRAYLPFEQHQIFGRKLHDAFEALADYERELLRYHQKSETKSLRASIQKAMTAINEVRNDGENLLCRAVPNTDHTCNVCTVYYGPFREQQ